MLRLCAPAIPHSLRVAAVLCAATALVGGAMPVAAQPTDGSPGTWTGPRYGPARQTAPDARRESLTVFTETRAECRQGAGRNERRECMREAVRQDDSSLRRLPAPRDEGQLEQPQQPAPASNMAPTPAPSRAGS